MWENFRARLPYLYDPWSEIEPSPPTLMHAMIAVSILVDCGALLTGIVYAVVGRAGAGAAQALGYGICALGVFYGMSRFLDNRGVPAQEVWSWRSHDAAAADSEPWWRRWFAWSGVKWCCMAAGAGLALGLFAHLFVFVLQHIPAIGEMLRKSQQEMAKIPHMRFWYALMAVGFAPFAEEYLFRGLLFRALDREWGGWRAVAGGAAFFAIYHSPMAWLPVGLLGALNCVVFKKSRRLVPAVILHMVYNAVVLA
jgi:membrane protease YdiL (CAAX protease family)